ncbi:hypothetical protein SAMN05216532_8610 [Streptomyces sp. 2231.1]|uniref:hypothetical protein n=1 Tax=Streptomyces sp. 2231.1 TaxID=1855347 RepID=UPI00089CDD6B|nr:hypothetical protein [Streptomyces sp. 2231.1]SEE69746.1 hypothetical protein SAMN05216532_8460 [Streptomyces sp. 2231.1]SEE73060.1 hypothetical protein SAMN05216532_8610 [Streptomyces sp. 2231.1]
MQLRFIGTTSENGNCPTLYEDTETGDIVVQGYTVTDPADIAQLRDVLDSESFVRIPRELLTRFTPREEE